MMPLTFFSQRVYLVAAISIVSVALIGMLLFQTRTPLARAFGYNSAVSASPNTVYLSGNAAAATTTVESPAQEVHIANNGLVLLRGARVLSVSGSTATISMTWGSSEFTWTVQTDFSTKFFDAQGEKSSLANLRIGDFVTVTGKITQSGARPIVDADIVRE